MEYFPLKPKSQLTSSGNFFANLKVEQLLKTLVSFKGFPIACEGDVDGALGCLIGKLLGCGTVYLSDWLEHDKSTVTLWHGGMAPMQVCFKEFFSQIRPTYRFVRCVKPLDR